MNHEAKDRREFFRIKYPRSERRYVNINGRNFRVLDLSSGGVKLYGEDVSEFKVGQIIDAETSLHDETTLYLFGKIIRIENNEMAVRLSTPIPGDKIINEQRYLINNYTGYQ